MKIKHLFLSVLAMASVAVACDKENQNSDKPSLKLDPATVEFEATAGTKTVKVDANQAWAIDGNDYDWVTLSQEEGDGAADVEITVLENTSAAARTANITFRCSIVKKTLKITQTGVGGGEPVGEGDGTKEKPYSASQAVKVAAALEKDAYTDSEVYVRGFITKIKEIDTGTYGNATFWISDDGTETTDPKPLYVFRIKDIDGAKFTDANKIKEGDDVVVYGKLQNYYGNTPQVSKGGNLVSVNGVEPEPPVVEEVTVTGLIVAVSAKGFLVKTDDGMKYVFDSSITPEVSVGDNVTVKGNATEHNGTPEIEKYTVKVNSTGNAVAHPEAVAITSDNIAAYNTLFSYVKTTGKLVISGNYYNIEITGANKTGSLAYAKDVDAGLNGKYVDVEGYFVGFTGSGNKYFNILYTNIVESAEQPVEPEKPVVEGEITLDIASIASSFTSTTVNGKAAISVTSNGVTLSVIKTGSTAPILPSEASNLVRFHQSNTMTIEVAGKKISSVVLTCPYADKCASFTVTSGDGGTGAADTSAKTVTWSGTAVDKFVCTADKQSRFSKITIIAK